MYEYNASIIISLSIQWVCSSGSHLLAAVGGGRRRERFALSLWRRARPKRSRRLPPPTAASRRSPPLASGSHWNRPNVFSVYLPTIEWLDALCWKLFGTTYTAFLLARSFIADKDVLLVLFGMRTLYYGPPRHFQESVGMYIQICNLSYMFSPLYRYVILRNLLLNLKKIITAPEKGWLRTAPPPSPSPVIKFHRRRCPHGNVQNSSPTMQD